MICIVCLLYVLRLWWHTALEVSHKSSKLHYTSSIMLKCQLIISRQALCLAQLKLDFSSSLCRMANSTRDEMGAWQVSEPWGHHIALTQMPPDILGRTGRGRDDWNSVPRKMPIVLYCIPCVPLAVALGASQTWQWLRNVNRSPRQNERRQSAK